MKFDRAVLSPPITGLLMFWAAVACSYLLLFLGSYYSLLSLPFLIILYHGAHEAVHNTLVPRAEKFSGHRAWHNFVAGLIGYAATGHNFLLVRRSHQAHHWCGRLHARCTIDGGLNTLGLIGHVRYYFLLFGFGYFLHELAGYLYLFVPRRYIPLDVNFNPRRYGRFKYLTCQTMVLCVTTLFFFNGGKYYVLCKVIYGLYWGFTQNVAHYGLEIGESNLSRFAARSYKVPPFWETLLFGSVFHHLEHHLFPFVPGSRLKHTGITIEEELRLGGLPLRRIGVLTYLRDFLHQLKGPLIPSVNPKEWLTNDDRCR